MKISYVKFKGDNKNFRLAKGMGFDVFELEEPEQIDIELKKLKNKKPINFKKLNKKNKRKKI